MAAEYPNTYFWFSRYGDPSDVDDCDISKIPNTHKVNGQHLSLRLRFRPDSNEEEFLKELKGNFEWSDFLPFDILRDLGGTGGKRFYSGDGDGATRASLVSHVLCANSRLVLDSFGDHGFEINENEQNQLNKSYFTSMHHMANNIYGVGFEPFPLVALDAMPPKNTKSQLL